MASQISAVLPETGAQTPWHGVDNIQEVISPALLVYADRVEENLDRMIAAAGGPARLRPHIKTHKMAEVILMNLARGIIKFKCATIAEAEMAARCGAQNVLMAYQLVGPNIGRFIALVKGYPATKFSAIADDPACILALANGCRDAGVTVELLLDIDSGMHRSGVVPGPRALELYRLIAASVGLTPGGLHAYDGNIHEKDPQARSAACDQAYAPVETFRQELIRASLPVPKIVAGGTPTFPIHARRPDVECSPGTCVFWDAGYASRFPDLEFQVAALVVTRVVSKPGPRRLCLDLGHKSIASENAHPRVHFLNLPEAQPLMHSEEHLVVETDRAEEFAVGACLFGIPWHICPTVAQHAEAVIVRKQKAVESWKITPRERRLVVG